MLTSAKPLGIIATKPVLLLLLNRYYYCY